MHFACSIQSFNVKNIFQSFIFYWSYGNDKLINSSLTVALVIFSCSYRPECTIDSTFSTINIQIELSLFSLLDPFFIFVSSLLTWCMCIRVLFVNIVQKEWNIDDLIRIASAELHDFLHYFQTPNIFMFTFRIFCLHAQPRNAQIVVYVKYNEVQNATAINANHGNMLHFIFQIACNVFDVPRWEITSNLLWY